MLRHKRLPRYFDVLWLAWLTFYIVSGSAPVPFHGDESTLFFMGRDYHYLFVQGDLSKIYYDRAWSSKPSEQHLRLLNGTISKTIYGWLTAHNGLTPADINNQWVWSKDYAYNAGRGHIPQATLLQQGRLASALQLALAVVLFFKFADMTLNRPSAYLASALFALQPNVLINGRRAMMEGSHLLGLLLLLLMAAWLLRERKWWQYPLLGVCAGFAVATKHPNIISGALVFIALALAAWRNSAWIGQWWRHLAGLLVAGLAALLLFLLLNPAWWSAPLELGPLVMEMRSELLQGQVNVFGGYTSFAEGLSGFFDFVFSGQYQYFEVARWAGYDAISAQIETYESSGWAGLLIGGTSLFGFICLALAVFGASALLRSQRVTAENKLLLFVWIGGSALLTLLLTPLPWARYYLPLQPALMLLLAYALVVSATALWPAFKSKTDGFALLA